VEENRGSNEVFSEKVRAGRRTYFFDIKSTKDNDYFITITEIKKRFKDLENEDVVYEKHKIFLYKEDLEKFSHAFSKTSNHLRKNLLPDYDFENSYKKSEE
jgi:lipopolysaccharide export LptBFGC system permease protein LptF